MAASRPRAMATAALGAMLPACRARTTTPTRASTRACTEGIVHQRVFEPMVPTCGFTVWLSSLSNNPTGIYCDAVTSPSPPAAPPPASACVCAATWTSSDSTECQVTQYGCELTACDGDGTPWCNVASLPCFDSNPSSGVNTGSYGGNW
eukprot:3055761-Prymnesium_polylepis.2